MTRPVTRRTFIGAGAVAVAALAPSVTLAAPRQRTVFRLDGTCGGSCTSCNACSSHADAMLFARREDIRRAHVGCDCVVVEDSLPFGSWVALYGHPDHLRTGEADRRDRRVEAILQTKL